MSTVEACNLNRLYILKKTPCVPVSVARQVVLNARMATPEHPRRASPDELEKLRQAGAEWRARTATEQGLPVAVQDPAILDRLAAMFLASEDNGT